MAGIKKRLHALTLQQIARILFTGASVLTLPTLCLVVVLIMGMYFSMLDILQGDERSFFLLLIALAAIFFMPVFGGLLMRDYHREMMKREPVLPRRLLWILSTIYNIAGSIFFVFVFFDFVHVLELNWINGGALTLLIWCCSAAALSVRGLEIVNAEIANGTEITA